MYQGLVGCHTRMGGSHFVTFCYVPPAGLLCRVLKYVQCATGVCDCFMGCPRYRPWLVLVLATYNRAPQQYNETYLLVYFDL